MKTLVLARAAAVVGILASIALVSTPAYAAPRPLPEGDLLFTIACDDAHPEGQLLSLDPATAAATAIGVGTPDISFNCAGQAAWNAATSTAYYVLYNGEDRLASIDLTTGVTTVIGTFGTGNLSTGADSMAIAPNGDAFFISDGDLYSLDLAIADGTLIGALGIGGSISAFAADPTSGILYGITDKGDIYTINPVTGAATLLGTVDFSPTNTNAWSLQVASDGILWIENDIQIDQNTWHSQLWSVDPTVPSTTDELSGLIAESGAGFYTESLLLTVGWAPPAVVIPAAPTLPDTGADVAPIALAGLVLGLTGVVLLTLRRRGRTA
jgi:LPXTG-motif cell wall-anchored protein